jgi:hypothetical protein
LPDSIKLLIYNGISRIIAPKYYFALKQVQGDKRKHPGHGSLEMSGIPLDIYFDSMFQSG